MEKSEAELRICVEKLRQNVEERDEMIGFMSRKADDEEDVKEAKIHGHGSKSRATFGRNVEEGGDLGECCTDFSRIGRIRVSQGLDPVPEACFMERIMERNAAEADGMVFFYGQRNDFGRDFLPSASVAWMERSSEWQQLLWSRGMDLHLYHLLMAAILERHWTGMDCAPVAFTSHIVDT
ncbi:uncharacterized protein LOC131253231 isoform X1 [Magnolia sinica]|uniref:uncharacterized protein LOC131253231 isoform X1 n=1 Tax=Magnolia sinica TaxID=86752 RepID=UPI0026587587|nr:uncharacterized protein LOC131253231 isoform X1 [Magnolia sinica]